ncbi:hypothetical protein F5H01DRAFT_169002 [Linnemannia elongata]|nr:hypothetical protein F5H01DRAFT_169002 [Linnemannia elongata]
MFTDYLPLNNNQQQTGETTLPRKTLPLFHAFPLLASFVFCCFIFTLGPFSTVKNSAHYFFFRRSLFCHPPSLSIASLDIVISLQLLCLSLSFFSSLWSICRSFLSQGYHCFTATRQSTKRKKQQQRKSVCLALRENGDCGSVGSLRHCETKRQRQRH